MSKENEFNISKRNRRRVEEVERQKEIYNPFTIRFHIPTRKDRDRRAHELERKAAKKR